MHAIRTNSRLQKQPSKYQKPQRSSMGNIPLNLSPQCPISITSERRHSRDCPQKSSAIDGMEWNGMGSDYMEMEFPEEYGIMGWDIMRWSKCISTHLPMCSRAFNVASQILVEAELNEASTPIVQDLEHEAPGFASWALARPFQQEQRVHRLHHLVAANLKGAKPTSNKSRFFYSFFSYILLLSFSYLSFSIFFLAFSLSLGHRQQRASFSGGVHDMEQFRISPF